MKPFSQFVGIIFLALPTLGSSQSQCFKEFLDLGVQAYNREDFQGAFANFRAISGCDQLTTNQVRQMNEWIDKANKGYADFMTKARKDAEDARDRALNALDEAQQARDEAQLQASISEANRLAFIASQEVEKGNGNDALVLAYRAMDLTRRHPTPSILLSFGNAIDASYGTTLAGHDQDVLSMNITPDHQAIITSSADGTVKIWNPEGALQHTLSGISSYCSKVVLAPSNDRFLAVNADRKVSVYSLDGKILASTPTQNEEIAALAISHDGSTFATGGRDGQASLFDWQGNLIASLNGHQAPVNAVQFSPDDSKILTVSTDKTARMWRRSDGTFISTLQDPAGFIYQAAFSPDGNRILLASSDHFAYLYDGNGQLIQKLAGHDAPVVCAALSINHVLLTASLDGKVMLWDQDGNHKVTKSAHEQAITLAGFSPDGNYWFTGSRDHTVKIWTVEGTLKAILNQHLGTINDIVFSPDSQLILTASADHTAKLWDLAGNLRMNQDAFQGEVLAAGFTSDGNLLWSCSSDGGAHVVDNPEVLFAKLTEHPVLPDERQIELYHLNGQ